MGAEGGISIKGEGSKKMCDKMEGLALPPSSQPIAVSSPRHSGSSSLADTPESAPSTLLLAKDETLTSSVKEGWMEGGFG